jgi:GNAT superfamily N-acetyltransferase
MELRPWRDPDPVVEAVHAELVQRGVMAPLALGGDEERLWSDCDLASLAEHRLGDACDPRRLDDARREAWIAQALTEKQWPPGAREFERCYWLLDGREPAGTVAVATSALGGDTVRVSSLYLFPTHRGRGAARAALDQLRLALARRGFALRLETSWSWQRAVRFYLHIGMWVRSWKHAVAFWWSPELPPREIEVGQERARFAIASEGAKRVVLLTAERSGDRLQLVDPPAGQEPERFRLDALTTFSVALAMHGWPLVRSQDLWERCRHSDLGPPESLAYRIAVWEAWERHHGWRVETPRIPGLDYPTWGELEARWKAIEEEYARGNKV